MRSMNGIMGHVQEKRRTVLNRFINLPKCLKSKSFRKECVCSMVLVQPRDSPRLITFKKAIAILPEIASRFPDRRSRDVNIKSDFKRIRGRRFIVTKMGFTYMDRTVTLVRKKTREGIIFRR